MKIFRAKSLLVATVGALAWGIGAPANADSTVTSVQTSVSGAVGGTEAQVLSSSSSTDSLTGTTTEKVSFSGKVVIKARVTQDPDFRTPDIVVLFVDLSGISGVGETTRKKYVTSDKTIIQRRLRPSDSVRHSFPFWVSGTTATGEGPVGIVSFTLNFDVNTRKLTGATGSITSP